MRSIRMLVALTTVGAISVILASPALADNSCPSGTCQTVPATATTHTTTDKTSASHTKIVIKKTVKAKIRQYEKAHNVVVAIYQRPNGVQSYRGCIDPIAKGWIKDGGAFRNTRSNGSPFWTYWKAGWRICNPHRVRIGKNVYMEGTKMNCGNRHILIPIHVRSVPKVRREVEFRTVKKFTSVYEKWVKKETSSTSTTTTSTTYSCPAGWTLSGTQCRLCPPPPSCPPPPPPPLVTTTVHALTTHDVYSGDTVDLCFSVARSDGSAVDPGQLLVTVAEGQIQSGTLRFVSGEGWCQRWTAPVTTVTHGVIWTAYAYGEHDSNVMAVQPQFTGP